MLDLLGKDSPNDNINRENARIETDLTGEKKKTLLSAADAECCVCLFVTYSFKLFLLISVWETAICEFSVFVSVLLVK